MTNMYVCVSFRNDLCLFTMIQVRKALKHKGNRRAVDPIMGPVQELLSGKASELLSAEIINDLLNRTSA